MPNASTPVLGRLALAFATLLLSACGARDPIDQAQPEGAPGFFEIKEIVEEAYIYGFPMIANYKAMYQFNVDKAGAKYKGEFNRIYSDARVLTPQDTTIVTPNSDTPYSMLQLDLRAEPMVVCVPAVDPKRYYSVQLADMYASNYGYIGSRATGSEAGCYLVSGPGWQGALPAGVKQQFRSETQFSLALFRTQLFSPSDMEAVKAVQAGYRVQPLSGYLNSAAPPAPPRPNFPVFQDNNFKTDFIAPLNFLLQYAPEVAEEKAARARFARIGIAPGKPFDFGELSLLHKVAVAWGIKSAFSRIEDRRDNFGKLINGWSVAAAFGDRSFYQGDTLLRATAALAGIFGNNAEEAMYPMARKDASGQLLDGSKHKYTMTFAAGQYPPVHSFWSITMYDGKTQLLIDNPINRYLINSPMLSDIKQNPDGSLTIYIQKDSPGKDKESNWLPAPNGPIYTVMRLYWPKTEAPSILPPGSGSWQPPEIKLAD